MYDIVIKGGMVVDGSGAPPNKADVAIKGDKIAKIGDVDVKSGRAVISAEGLTVVPGFIDVLNHADTNWTLFRYPDQDSMLLQGVTTIIGGNCGSSLAPLVKGESLLSIQKWADISKENVNWQEFSELIAELEKKTFGVNFGSLVGHSTLRRGLLGDEVRDIGDDEIKKMQYLAQKSIAEGAFGLSCGLAFAHSRGAKMYELTELAKTVKKAGGVFACHLRNESDGFVDAFNEIAEVAQSTGVPVEISHMKASGPQAARDMRYALERISKLNEDGFDVTFDIFPYDFSASVLYTILPEWVTQGGKYKVLQRLKQHDVRKVVIEDLREKKPDYDNIVIATAHVTKNYTGMSIAEIARREGLSPDEMLIHILIANDQKVIAFMKNLSADILAVQAAHPAAIYVSDGFGVKKEVMREGVLIHPRCVNSFPKFLHEFVVNKKVISLESAIRKMTGFPAKKYGIKNRGLLKEGYCADIAVLNTDALSGLASLDNPFIYPAGVEHVFVNGVAAVSNNNYTGALAGKILRK